MDKVDILIHYDELQKSLFDIYFYPSYQKYLSSFFNLISIKENTDAINKSCDYLSDHWQYMIVKRFDYIKDYIKKNIDSNKLAIFSDIDVVFFNNISQEIELLNKQKDIHIFYMKEAISYPEYMINGGFFVFRCCYDSLAFFDMIQKETASSDIKNDQPIIQNIFKNKIININYSLLDADVFCTNNNSIFFTKKIIDTMKVFHATSASTLIEKCQVLSSIYITKKILEDQTFINGKNIWI